MKNQKITKGTSSAVLLSILIHATLFLLAGTLVVFTVVKKKEIEFEPPKAVERPKMKLKKPKPKVKKSSRPKKAQHILAKVDPVNMPEIQLPELSGMGGDGLGEGIVGGFDMMPDLGETTLFGGGQSIGNDFVGTFYDFKRDRNGRDIPMHPNEFSAKLSKFVRNGWKVSDLSRYYRSSKKLYATCFMIPPVLSVLAPEAFGEFDTIGYCWLVHYQGQLVHKDGITFRFWGMGDDVLVVRVNGEVVLDACWPDEYWGTANIVDFWQSSSSDSSKYFYGQNKAVVGDWITLKPGEPLDMEIIVAEGAGGCFQAMLSVEVEGVEYERGPQWNPILPMFKTAVPSLDLIETIHADLIPGEACVTNGPVFCDYDSLVVPVEASSAEPIESPVFADSIEKKVRTWILDDGKNLEAKFVVVISEKAVLKDSKGRHRKIPLNRLSDEDRRYIELARPPKFNIDFPKRTSQHRFGVSPYFSLNVPEQVDYVFGARLRQTSAGKYNHELKIEFFAIGEEIDGDNYILFDRQESCFTPTKENGRSHEFSGKTVPVRDKTIDPWGSRMGQSRGDKYGGYLVVVTDERGVVIDHSASHKWLVNIIGELRCLPVGKHFDKAGHRVCPPRPKPSGFY